MTIEKSIPLHSSVVVSPGFKMGKVMSYVVWLANGKLFIFDLNGWTIVVTGSDTAVVDGEPFDTNIAPPGYDTLVTSRFFFLRGVAEAPDNIKLTLVLEFENSLSQHEKAIKSFTVTFPKPKQCATTSGSSCATCATGYFLKDGACSF